jgi:hypothetical protein
LTRSGCGDGGAHALLWAVPDGWLSFELFQPDIEERIEGHIRELWASAGLDPAGADDAVATQLGVARQMREAGVLLMAASAQGAGTLQEPLSAVSLTLALRPLEESPGPSPGAGETVRSDPRPLVLQDPLLCGFVQEIRTGPLLTVEAFVAHREVRLLAALAVATTDPNREEEPER